MMDYMKEKIENFLDYIADAVVDIDLDFEEDLFDDDTSNEVA
jgi:hypothetical protein